MTDRIDVVKGLVESQAAMTYQRGKAAQYGDLTRTFYNAIVQRAAERGDTLPSFDMVKDRRGMEVFSFLSQIVTGIADDALMRRQFLREVGNLQAFALNIEDFVVGNEAEGRGPRGQLPKPPAGFVQLKSGPDAGKLGFPEGHRFHPANFSPTPRARVPTSGGAVHNAALNGFDAPDAKVVQAAGASANLLGAPKSSNPWPRRAAAHGWWLAGWMTADASSVDIETAVVASAAEPAVEPVAAPVVEPAAPVEAPTEPEVAHDQA